MSSGARTPDSTTSQPAASSRSWPGVRISVAIASPSRPRTSGSSTARSSGRGGRRGVDGQPHDRASGRRDRHQPSRTVATRRPSPATGAGRPVISSTCAAAWCSSIRRTAEHRRAGAPRGRGERASATGRRRRRARPARAPAARQRTRRPRRRAASRPRDRRSSAAASTVERRRRSAATPSRSRGALAARAARAGSRTSTVHRGTPSSASAATHGLGGAAGAEHRRPTAGRPRPRARAATMPATSVLSAIQPPPGRGSRVLPAPTAAAAGRTSSATSSTACLSGIVHEKPAQSARSASTPRSSSTPQSIAS